MHYRTIIRVGLPPGTGTNFCKEVCITAPLLELDYHQVPVLISVLYIGMHYRTFIANDLKYPPPH
jgi:hypothetical protein